MKFDRLLMQMARQAARSSGSNMWQVEVRHDGLNKYRVIRGRDKREVEEKARVQLAVWNEVWQKKLEAEQKAFEREGIRQRFVRKRD